MPVAFAKNTLLLGVGCFFCAGSFNYRIILSLLRKGGFLEELGNLSNIIPDAIVALHSHTFRSKLIISSTFCTQKINITFLFTLVC